MKRSTDDPLAKFRSKARAAILSEYPSIENFCFANDLPKSTVSRLFSPQDKGTIGFQVKTLLGVTKALGKNLDIDIK